MIQAVLMNFGDNTRVVYDIKNKPFAIEIGQVVEADIHDVHFHMIKRGVATDTLMVVPKEAPISPKLQAILDILKSIETDPYDQLLQKFNVVAAEIRNEEVPLQPARHMIRRLLRDLAKYEVAKALHMTSKVVIHEQGDETTRQVVPPPQPEPKVVTPPPDDKAPAKKAQFKRTNPPKKPVSKTRTRERL